VHEHVRLKQVITISGQYNLVACLVTEIVLTFTFLMIILGATDRQP
jgi:hypothetical protein